MNNRLISQTVILPPRNRSGLAFQRSSELTGTDVFYIAVGTSRMDLLDLLLVFIA